MNTLATLDKAAVQRAFARAAAGYDAAAVLQREIGTRLFERLALMKIEPQQVLDLGCGTGRLTRQLLKRYPRAEVFGADLALPMLHTASHDGFWPWRRRARWIAADAARLPLATASCDLIVSNLMLQWCDPDAVFAECRRLLRPGGLLLFTTFGPDTLKELRAAWQVADGGVHVHDFTDMHDLGDALLRAHFADPVMDVEHLTLTYNDVADLLRDLKAIGAHNAANDRPRALTGKARFARFRAAYEQFRARDGRLPASHEIVYGHAWAPLAERAPGESRIPVTAIKRSRP